MARSSTLLLLVLLGCTRSHTVESGFSFEKIVEDEGECEEQMEAAMDGLPVELACTGLYASFETKKLAKGVEMFEPAYKLWSDGSEKTRWIQLPEDEVIDTSDMRKWRFPRGTKVWKEFRANNRRAETRLYVKDRDDDWVRTTYVWEKDEKTAKRLDNGTKLALNGASYEVPDVGKCNDCHDGARDNVLGFEAVSLGLPGANQAGLTLAKLVERGLLSDPPERTTFEIGDDGTGEAADALGWLHVNCGITCHNDGVNSKAEETDLRMKLDPAELDGRAPAEFEALKQLLNQPAKTTQWQGQTRIVPGNPDESLLYQLITTRLGVDGNRQMPPLLTRVVPNDQTDQIRDWINAMEPAPAEPEAEISPE